MMIATSPTNTKAYEDDFARFDARCSGRAPDWLREMRRSAFERFQESGFPTTRHEEWRFTNVAPLTKQRFEREPSDGVYSSQVERVVGKAVLSETFHRLVFVNGRFADRWSTKHELPDGVAVESLANSFRSRSELSQSQFERPANGEESPFTTLNTAFIEDGAYVHVPDGLVVEEPIHLLFISTAGRQPVISHPRNVVRLGKHSRATVVESYVGIDGERYFNNIVTETVLAESARLDHYKLLQEHADAYHVATTQVRQQQGSRFNSHYFSMGGSLVRNEVNVVLDGEEVECTLNGLFLAAGRQHVDCRTRIDHAKPNGNSFESYKGILDGHAHGVFNGKIYVHPDAQKTDARQNNQVLLLSDDAVVDTKPQLEIYADDVKCTHGATVGELDEQAMYYLRSRGIPADTARSLLLFAFANEVVRTVQVEPLRNHVESLLLAERQLPRL